MDGKEAAELVEVGQKIVELGGELEAARAKRDEFVAEVQEIEAELRPLLARHGKLVLSMAGVVPPSDAINFVNPPNQVPTHVPEWNQSMDQRKAHIQKKVFKALEQMDPETRATATNIANLIEEDPAVVREVMRDSPMVQPVMEESETKPGVDE